jgi:hypothetical protein
VRAPAGTPPGSGASATVALLAGCLETPGDPRGRTPARTHPADGAPERRCGADRCDPGSPQRRRVRLPGASVPCPAVTPSDTEVRENARSAAVLAQMGQLRLRRSRLYGTGRSVHDSLNGFQFRAGRRAGASNLSFVPTGLLEQPGQEAHGLRGARLTCVTALFPPGSVLSARPNPVPWLLGEAFLRVRIVRPSMISGRRSCRPLVLRQTAPAAACTPGILRGSCVVRETSSAVRFRRAPACRGRRRI